MPFVTSILRAVFDALLLPFRTLHPLVGLTLASLLLALLVLVVLKYTSRQEKIEAVKRKIHAGLFEIRLFNDDARAIVRAMGSILRHNAVYLALWLVPFLWMLPPMLLMLGQLQFHYGYRALDPGEQTLLTVELKEAPASKPAVKLDVPAGLRVETPSVWVPSEKQLTWRIAAVDLGDYELGVEIDGQRYAKDVQVGGDIRRRSPVRPGSSFFAQLLYPAEAPLPADAPLVSITVDYRPADGGIGLDSELTWMLVLFVLSIVFAYALRKPFGVTF
jgi:hypothetical protein